MAWSPNSRYIASADRYGKVQISNISRLLLALRAPTSPTLRQYLLLHTLAGSREPVLIGQTDKKALDSDGMKEVKELLKVEKSKSRTRNPIWRLTIENLQQKVADERREYQERLVRERLAREAESEQICCIL